MPAPSSGRGTCTPVRPMRMDFTSPQCTRKGVRNSIPLCGGGGIFPQSGGLGGCG